MFNDSRSAMSSRPPPASQLPLCLIKVWLSWCLSMQRERRCSLLRHRQCLQKNSSSFKSGAKKCAKIAVITFLSCPLKSSAIWGKLTIQIWKVKRGCLNGHIPKTPKHKYLLSFLDIEKWKWLKNVINQTTIWEKVCALEAGIKIEFLTDQGETFRNEYIILTQSEG